MSAQDAFFPEPSHCPEEACDWALGHLQAFLHGELDEQEADTFRRHLAACESCLDEADLEAAVSRALRRCHHTVRASSSLRMRVVRLHIEG
ncbi:mycothiol system anti-sigma-R factor [Acidipropionibacterium jensenii]|uniref:zf-HC2 domain-containing protein n=1 Tax=Acidipropionibacterium jensenii TaxID=1749 RepID=UPI00110AF8B5|nr:zf-HC2 domain-containing protein [Acidipropionibacterium jensenii]QCV88749.1 mycothiol system anti-sigma-R factor [Acidipropionibacterium jensenii]